MNILVTGGASCLGEAITRRLAANPLHKIYFSYNSSVSSSEKIINSFPNTYGFQLDLKNQVALEGFIGEVSTLNIDAVVHNAFTGFEEKHFHKISWQEFSDGFLSNVIPVIKLTQALIPGFKKNRFGKIITILTAALVNRPPVGWSEYVAGKAYLHSLVKSWAVEYAAYNITSNAISPAFMETSLTSFIDPRVVEEMKSKHHLKSLLRTDEVAEVVNFFLESTQQINGHNFLINSGQNVI